MVNFPSHLQNDLANIVWHTQETKRNEIIAKIEIYLRMS